MWKLKVPIVEKESLPGPYLRLRFRSSRIAGAARPGQFINILTDPSLTPFLRRPIGIEDVDTSGGTVSLLIKVVGPGTLALDAASVGDELDVLGPLGRGFDLENLGRRCILVAGGTGIAPFLHLARVVSERKTPVEMILFYGGRTREDLASWSFFEGLVARAVATTEDASFGRPGLVTLALQEYLAETDPKNTRILCCGPLPMMKVVSRLARDFAIPCFVSLETMMGCGIGSCLACVTPLAGEVSATRFARVCTEGPVFDAARLDWEGLG